MQERIELVADEGMIYTNGDTYGVIIYPANGLDISKFYQIPIEEYNKLLEEQMQSLPNN